MVLLFAELLLQKLILTGQNLFRLTKLVKQHPMQNLFMPASASVCINVVQIFDKSQIPYKSLNRYQNQDIVISKKCEEILTRIY